MAFSFGEVKNQVQTTIGQDMTDASPAAGANLTVGATAALPAAPSYALIGAELIYYDLIVDGTHVRIGTGGRGALGTTAAAHSSGDVFYADVIVSAHINELVAKFDDTTGHAHTGGTDDGPAVDHADLSNVTGDQHHPQDHAHSGSDGTSNLAQSAITNLVTDLAAKLSLVAGMLVHVVTWLSPSAANAMLLLDSYGDPNRLTQRYARGTQASPTAVLSGDVLVSINARGYHSGGAFSTGADAAIGVIATENFTATQRGTKVTIASTAVGATGALTRIAFDETGADLQSNGIHHVADGVAADDAATVGQLTAFPQYGIIMTNQASCPSGFTEYTATRGRAIVGVPSGGTVEGTVGTALTNTENRTHTHNGPSHSHNFNDEGGGVGSGTAGGNPVVMDQSNASGRPVTVSTGGGSTGWYIKSGTRASGTGATTATAITDGAGLPYIQLRFCQKS